MTKSVQKCFEAEIGLLIFPDCQLSAVFGLTDLFRIAGEWSGTSSSDRRQVRVTHWEIASEGGDETEAALECVWDSHPGIEHHLDYVIAPPSIVMPEYMVPMPAIGTWLRQLHTAGTRVCSICAGAFVLADSGLMDGRRVTTHWAFAKQLSKQFPKIEVAAENIVIDDGDILSAGGILAWTDLGLTLVARLLGESTMLATARFLVIDPPRKHQRPYRAFFPSFDHGDDAIVKVQHRLHAKAADPHSIQDLAKFAGITERTFMRRFSKATGYRPTQYIQEVRVAKARELLETTNRPIDQIAWDVGYGDPAAFRKIFQRLTASSPNSFRQRFSVI